MVGEVGEPTASCGGAWAEYVRIRQSTMKHVTAENAKDLSTWELKRARKKMKRLTAKVHGVSSHFFDHGFDTRSNVYKVNGQS